MDVKVSLKRPKSPKWKSPAMFLRPARYVGTDYVEEDEVFEEKMGPITKELSGQFKQSRIWKNE